jgi:phosphatidylinositol-3-phosphatase
MPIRTKPALLAAAVTAMLAAPLLTAPTATAAAGLPTPAHIVVVMEENHASDEIIGSSSAPYINSLAGQGALFTQSFAVAHPSEPNYLELFSGSTQGVSGDNCPNTYSAPNLGGEVLAAGESFAGYAESMPSDGYTGCDYGAYARKHVPWTNFTDVPAADSRTFAEFPQGNFAALPTVSFVIPNLNDDMHDGTVAQGDTWLQNNLDAYAQWAKANNSLLIVTWDEDDSSQSNQIPTIMVGANVKPGQYSEHITHDNVLRTIEDLDNLPYAGNSANVAPITDAFGVGGAAAAGPVTGYQGLCLDVWAGGVINGPPPVQVYDCNHGANQSWTRPGDGTLRSLGKCLEVQGGNTGNATPVQQNDCSGAGAQQWTPQANGELFNPQSGRCLDDSRYGGSGTHLIIYDCNDGTNQQWKLP